MNLSFWPCPDTNRQGNWEPPVHPGPAPRTLTSVGTLSQTEMVCFLWIHLTGREECGVRVLRASCGFHLPRGGVPSELSQGWVRPGDRNGALSGGGSPGELPSMDCHTGASLPLSRGHPHSVAQARSPGGGFLLLLSLPPTSCELLNPVNPIRLIAPSIKNLTMSSHQKKICS